jgi:hypothetical protein
VGGLTDDILDRGRHGEGLDTGNVGSSRNGHLGKLTELRIILYSDFCWLAAVVVADHFGQVFSLHSKTFPQ